MTNRFAKNLSHDQINVSTLKGEGELKNLELNEEVLTDLALDEARHVVVVRPLLRRLDHQSQQWHKPVDDAGDELCWRRPLR